MSKIWKPQSKTTLTHWLLQILEEKHRLNAWELSFVYEIGVRVQNDVPLTETQEKKLEEIYAEKTS